MSEEELARRLRTHQKVILFSTHGAPFLGKYHDSIKQILTEKRVTVIVYSYRPAY